MSVKFTQEPQKIWIWCEDVNKGSTSWKLGPQGGTVERWSNLQQVELSARYSEGAVLERDYCSRETPVSSPDSELV